MNLLKILKHNTRGFTLIELMVVISIISLLSSLVLLVVQKGTKSAYYARAREEMNQMYIALHMYSTDNGSSPCDVSRDLPQGLEKYLTTSPDWPKAPWPGSVYDWDFWDTDTGDACGGTLLQDSNPAHNQSVYQISIRFCDINGSNCRFPDEPWAANFNSNSSVYFCISGPCRAHGSYSYNHPGCCFGGNCPADQPTCK